jgi:hypothetical protein
MDMLRFKFAVWLLNFPNLRFLAYAIMTKWELEQLRHILERNGKIRR